VAAEWVRGEVVGGDVSLKDSGGDGAGPTSLAWASDTGSMQGARHSALRLCASLTHMGVGYTGSPAAAVPTTPAGAAVPPPAAAPRFSAEGGSPALPL
jgi:hypothetical protein